MKVLGMFGISRWRMSQQKNITGQKAEKTCSWDASPSGDLQHNPPPMFMNDTEKGVERS